jgi:hypothetical protein
MLSLNMSVPQCLSSAHILIVLKKGCSIHPGDAPATLHAAACEVGNTRSPVGTLTAAA